MQSLKSALWFSPIGRAQFQNGPYLLTVIRRGEEHDLKNSKFVLFLTKEDQLLQGPINFEFWDKLQEYARTNGINILKNWEVVDPDSEEMPNPDPIGSYANLIN